MRKPTAKRALIALLFFCLTHSFRLLGQTPSNSDLWDIAQGNAITYNSALYSGSDIRDMFGGQFSATNTGYTLFADQPAGTVNAVEWQTPYYATITNFHLFLSPDPQGGRDIGSFNLYAYNGFAFQLVFSSNNIPTYSIPSSITGAIPAMTANRWRAEFTTASSGASSGPRVDELDGFGTILTPLNVGSDGTDGALVVTASTNIDLSKASYGTWTDDNSTNQGNGIYDANKWAVVFKYSSVSIAAGATVTFSNHPSHAPVVWLVQSNVMIAGHLSLDGGSQQTAYPVYLSPTEPGPGGFRGGPSSPSGVGAGYGPGGGSPGQASYGDNYGTSYGNPQALPLLGGSGAGANYLGTAGPSGGGALLIAAGQVATITGSITAAQGGFSFYDLGDRSDLSGAGAIRLVANVIEGNGSVTAAVVRAEANSLSPSVVLTPNTIAVSPGTSPTLWPANNAPVVTIVSVNGSSVPSDPAAQVVSSPDLSISTNNPVDIILQSQNFPPSGAIVVRVTPKYANFFNVNATFQSGSFTQANWKATTVLPGGFCVLQAHATSP